MIRTAGESPIIAFHRKRRFLFRCNFIPSSFLPRLIEALFSVFRAHHADRRAKNQYEAMDRSRSGEVLIIAVIIADCLHAVGSGGRVVS